MFPRRESPHDPRLPFLPVILCSVLFASSSAPWAAGAIAPDGSRAITIEDLLRSRELQGIIMAPDGRRAVLTIGVVDQKKDAYTSDLWSLDLADGGLHRLTRDPGIESHPRFSPDGDRLAFLAKRGERTGAYALPLAGGDPYPLFTFKEDVTSFSWFPDGTQIIFTAREPKPEPGGPQAGPGVGGPGRDPRIAGVAEDTTPRSDVLIITRARFKSNDEGYLDGRRVHLWIADLENDTIRKISDGDYDHSQPAVSPDGRWIVFVSNRTDDPDRNYNTDIFAMPAGGGDVVRVSDQPGPAGNPRWSPDGRRLAFLEMRLPDTYGANRDIWVAAAPSRDPDERGVVPTSFGAPRNLTHDLDLTVGEGAYRVGGDPYPIWSADGKRLYVTLLDRARLHAYSVDPFTGDRRLLVGGDRMVEYLTPTPDGTRLVFGLTDGTHPSDVHVADFDGHGIRRLTQLNDGWFRSVRVSPPERFTYKSYDGLPIEGWIVTPLDAGSGKRYPTVLSIHGGPQWYYGVKHSFYFQLLAARGYLVIYTNPRGSTGYGERFTNIIRGRYGIGDYEDLMKAVDVIAERGLIDRANLFVGGYSYGGMMTNWIITRTDRFTAAASGASIADYGASIGPDDSYIDWIAEMGGAPWDDPDRYRALSPFTFVKNVRTPTLFYHGLEDYRCPVPESERMYLALRLRGVETMLALFPGENHSFDSKASHRRERLRLVMDWFDRHRR